MSLSCTIAFFSYPKWKIFRNFELAWGAPEVILSSVSFFVFEITWARLFNIEIRMLIYLVLKYWLLFMFKVSSSNGHYLLSQVSGILHLSFCFQHRSWATFFLGAVTVDLSRAFSLVLLTFAHVVAYLDSILTDSDCVRVFFQLSCLWYHLQGFGPICRKL